MTQEQPDKPRLLPFPTEDEAIAHVRDFLAPHCKSLVAEPTLRSGLRPDLGFRLHEAPGVPLVFEGKKFEPGKVSALIDAIRQAHSYTFDTGHIAVVGPIEARGPSHLSWYGSSIGAIGLLASEFSVGYLYAHPQGGGGIFLGGQVVARFNTDGTCALHSNAATLFARKQFAGSTTWRKAS